MKDNDTKSWTVYDGSRKISLTGTCLARASSHQSKKTRWINLGLFRTESGVYVLAGVGRTIVKGEVTRRWVATFDTPRGIIVHLTMRDEESGARYLPDVARRLLETAAEKDVGIHEAYYNVRIA